MTHSVKLSKLKRSDKNARTTPPKNIEAMAASQRARGILKNLLVTPCKPRGTFEIIDGDRRYLAAMMRVELGEIVAADYDVPVKIVTGDDAELREISLTANFQSVKMTVAEESIAFQHFLKTDGDIDAVAKRFGETRRFIEGRLRLADLAPCVFEALSEGRITLDMAKAYGSTDDNVKQERVFQQYAHLSYVTADQISRAITTDTMKATDPVALLVGPDAYVAAGGRITPTLFTEDGDRWNDPELAQSLAAAIMEAEAKRRGEELGIAWVRPVATTNLYGVTSDLHRVTLPPAAPTEEEAERSDQIVERCEAIEGEMEDESLEPEAYGALANEHAMLVEEYETLNSKPAELSDELKGRVGMFLTLNRDGTMTLDSTYYSETPIRLPGDDRPLPSAPSSRGTGPTAPEALAPGGRPLSARLHDELAVERRDILAASILADPGLALDYMLFSLADPTRSEGRRYGTTLRAGHPQDPQMPKDRPATQARQVIAEARDGLDASWTVARNPVDRFEAFRALSDDTKAAWLAIVVATSIEAKPDHGSTATNPLHARLASILEIEPAKWWRPTSANFFDRVSKGTLLALLAEVGGAPLAARYMGSKKGEVSSSCERLFAGESITEAATKEAALAWVPSAIRFDLVSDVLDDETPGEDGFDEDGDPDAGEEADDLDDAGDEQRSDNDGDSTLIAAE